MNEFLTMTLDDGVEEVLGMLTGLDLQYDADQDRYRSVARQINRALRSNALEKDWSYYASTETIGTVENGQIEYKLRSSLRPRIVGDDSARVVEPSGNIVAWAYFLPRDALHKYQHQNGYWASWTGRTLRLNRPFSAALEGFALQAPVLREPRQFELPKVPSDPNAPLVPLDASVRDEYIDFDYPDVIILRAAWQYAQSDPIMQPRVQTLEAMYKDLMYQLTERDDKNTDSPMMNDFVLPMEGSISGPTNLWGHGHPHSNAWGQ